MKQFEADRWLDQILDDEDFSTLEMTFLTQKIS